jgi:hypothetical protein
MEFEFSLLWVGLGRSSKDLNVKFEVSVADGVAPMEAESPGWGSFFLFFCLCLRGFPEWWLVEDLLFMGGTT